jgi:hypothetical protein
MNLVLPPQMLRLARKMRWAIFSLAFVEGAMGAGGAADLPSPGPTLGSSSGQVADFFNGLLPIAWQKRPSVVFNAYTEMTPEGRLRRVPTPDRPMYYYSPSVNFVQLAEIQGGEKPPPAASLEEAMRKALAANGYLPIPDDQQRPDLLIVFTFGSNNSGADGIDTADDIARRVARSPRAVQQTVERARFVAGNKFAEDVYQALKWEAIFPSSPDSPPFGVFMKSYDSNIVEHFLEIAFHSYYFATATAYDFGGVAKKQKIPLWQTRMAVEAQGVSMSEILSPLIANTGGFLGRETTVPQWLTKRVNREGRVDVGTATVVPDTKPGIVPEIPAPR